MQEHHKKEAKIASGKHQLLLNSAQSKLRLNSFLSKTSRCVA